MAGDTPSQIAFVCSGLLRSFYNTDDGREWIERDLAVKQCYYTLIESSLYEKERRSESLLLDSPLERYRYFQQRFPAVERKARGYMIASYIGITPEALCRLTRFGYSGFGSRFCY